MTCILDLHNSIWYVYKNIFSQIKKKDLTLKLLISLIDLHIHVKNFECISTFTAN